VFIWYIFPVWVIFGKKNLATLSRMQSWFLLFPPSLQIVKSQADWQPVWPDWAKFCILGKMLSPNFVTSCRTLFFKKLFILTMQTLFSRGDYLRKITVNYLVISGHTVGNYYGGSC
jgi:hypothetical protein